LILLSQRSFSDVLLKYILSDLDITRIYQGKTVEEYSHLVFKFLKTNREKR